MAETADLRLTRLAAPTGGVCRRSALLEAGVSDSSINRRLDTGHLVAVCRGVYIAPALANPTTKLWSAVLAVPGSMVSQQSAARLHGFALPQPERVHVTATKGTGRTVPGSVVHESRRLRGEDVALVNGLPVTSPERTLFDLAGVLRPARYRHLLQQQLLGSSPESFLACFRALARPGVPGVRGLRRLILELFDDEPFPASELEQQVWLALNQRQIPGFHRQYRPPWYDGRRGVVDLAAPDCRIIIEADGRRWHSSQQAMEDDRRRDRRASSLGWVVLRVTWHEVVHRPAATFDEIADVVAARRSQAGGMAA